MTPLKRRGTTINRIVAAFMFLSVIPAFISSASSQPIQTATAEEEGLLKQVFPRADVFSTKGGELPHHKAYQTNPETGARTLVGYVFFSTDVEPDEFAYASEIVILVGMTTGGAITGLRVLEHFEPYGNFSIDPPEFASQFSGKSILDRFETGRDVDAVTGATVTVDGAVRAIRKSARKIARKYLVREQARK